MRLWVWLLLAGVNLSFVAPQSADATPGKLLILHRPGTGYCAQRPRSHCTLFAMSQREFARTYPQGRTKPANRNIPPFKWSGLPTPAPFSSLSAGDGPPQLQQIYSAPAAGLRGGPAPIVMVLEYGHDPLADSDLAVFRSQFNLGACRSSTGCLRMYNASGGLENLSDPSTYPGIDPFGNGYDQEEEMLDLEAVSSLCPNCQLAVVEIDYTLERPDYSEMLSVGLSVARTVKPTAISISFAPFESVASDNEATLSHIQSAIFSASGDDGYAGANPAYPATSPHDVAVGQSNWHGPGQIIAFYTSGSGCSAIFRVPAWQAPLDVGCGGRAYADIAMQARFFPEYDSYCPLAFYHTTGLCGWFFSGGSSLSSPLAAGLYAYAVMTAWHTLQAPIAVPSGLYTQPNIFDITLMDLPTNVSNGGSCTPIVLCTVAVGWDGPSGLGSPLGPSVFLKRVTPHP